MTELSPPTPVHTYHCLCTTLILTTAHSLQTLPRRPGPIQDSAIILAPPVNVTRSSAIEKETTQTASSVLLNVAPERKPVIIRRDDGFEKRTLLRCTRCKLVIGYNIDEAQWENVEADLKQVYLLPGGVLCTADMVQGKRPEIPAWAEEA
jgi:hypothetical protein